MELTVSEFANLTSLSHRGVEDALRNIIAESQNCVLHSMFDDSVMLVDVSNDKIFKAAYTFDGDKFTIKEFEEVDLIGEQKNLAESVDLFFDDKIDAKTLAKRYSSSQEKEDNEFVENTLLECIKDHNPQTVLPYESWRTAKSKVDLSDIKKLEFFKHYQEKIMNEGFNEVEYFDFVNPVVITLKPLSSKKIKMTSESKAMKLWKNESFRASIKKGFETFAENVEEGANVIRHVFGLYPDIYILSESQEKAVISKSLLVSGVKTTDVEKMIKGFSIAKNKFGINEDKVAYRENYHLINEADAATDTTSTSDTSAGASDTTADAPVDSSTDTATDTTSTDQSADQVSTEDYDTIKSKLDEISKKIDDNDTTGVKEFIDNLKKKIDELKADQSTQPEFVKKLVSLLQ